MELIHSYVLSDCVQVEAGYSCLSTCESVWFKIDNATQAESYAEKCDCLLYTSDAADEL